jgi:predicted transcriptional regulator
MTEVTTKIQQRNREIGKIIREARGRKLIPVTKCADLIATSRRRYTAMENGEAAIGVAELEILIDFLDVPTQEIWGETKDVEDSQRVIIQARPGETFEIRVPKQK